MYVFVLKETRITLVVYFSLNKIVSVSSHKYFRKTNWFSRLPNIPNIKDFGKLTVKRDERIQKEIIEPKDKIIDMLYSDNKKLHQELEKQINAIDKAEKLENERQTILQEKVNLENKCSILEKDFHNKELKLKRNLNKKYDELLSENIYLNKIINTFEKTIKKFISWVCKKFAISEEDSLIRDFQQETNTFINPIKQIEYEKEQEEFEL